MEPLPIQGLAETYAAASAGERLDGVRRVLPDLRSRIQGSGRVQTVRTIDLCSVPVPVAAALGPVRVRIPFAILTVRMQVVRFRAAGRDLTLVWNPTDPTAELTLARAEGSLTSWGTSRVHTHPRDALGELVPDRVDLVAFPDLRGQDIPAILGAPGRAGLFPRARLVAPLEQLEAARRAHPLDRVAPVKGIADVAGDRLLPLGDASILGEGVALVHTPGPAPGHQSLFVHGADGVWSSSASAATSDAHAPYASRLPGYRAVATARRLDVIVPGGSPCPTEHYDSLILEKGVCDTFRHAPAFPLFIPVRALTAHARTLGLAPTPPTTVG